MQKITITNDIGTILIDSIDNPSIDSKILLTQIDGVSGLGSTTERQKAPFQDGSTFIKSLFNDRDFVIRGVILDTKENINASKRLLSKTFIPNILSTLEFMNETYRYEIPIYFDATPVFLQEKSNKGNMYQYFSVSATAYEPFFKDLDFTEITLQASVPGEGFPLVAEPTFSFEVGGSDTGTLTNLGDVNAPIEITFNGAATAPEITNTTTGQTIKVNKELLDGEKLIITTEFGNKTVIFDDGVTQVNAFGFIELDSEFFSLIPGENIIEYNAVGGNAGATVDIKYKNRYAGF